MQERETTPKRRGKTDREPAPQRETTRPKRRGKPFMPTRSHTDDAGDGTAGKVRGKTMKIEPGHYSLSKHLLKATYPAKRSGENYTPVSQESSL